MRHVAVFLLLASPALAQSQALEVANQTIADTWAELQPMFVDAIEEAVGGLEGAGTSWIEVTGVELTTLNLASPPQFGALQPWHIQVKAPGGSWSVGLEIEVEVYDFLEFTVNATLSNLQVKIDAFMSLVDPFRPKIVWVQPWVSYNLSLSSPNFLVNALAGLIQGALNSPITQAIGNLALTYFAAPMVVGQPAAPLAENAPFTSFAPTADLEASADAMRDFDLSSQMPHGLVVDRIADASGNWVGYGRHGDSAIYSGHMLAAAAFAWSETGDPQALAMAQQLVVGLRRLLDVGSSSTYQIGTTPYTGVTLPPEAQGRLVRYAARPADPYQGAVTFGTHYPAKSAEDEEPMSVAVIDGETWYGHPRSISRDQYTGVIQGLAMAHALVDDPTVQAVSAECLTRIMNYFLYNDWILDLPDGSFSTSYMTSHAHMVAAALAAREANPAQFASAVATYGPLARLAWLGAWFDSFDPHTSYFKYDLISTSLSTALELEDSWSRWVWEWYAVRILQRATGHHQNAYLSGIFAQASYWQAASWTSKVQEEMEQFLMRPHDPTPLGYNSPESLAYQASLPTLVNEPAASINFSLGGEIESEEAETIAATVIPVAYRPNRAYLWGRSPFALGGAPAGGTITRYPGVDYQLAYWLNRHVNALP